VTIINSLPRGFTLPGITRGDGSKMKPLCGYAVYEQSIAGWNADCMWPATFTAISADHSLYACADHAEWLAAEVQANANDT
jgi:hypothetical protein